MKKLIVHEVGPRDGLQQEKSVVPTEMKIAWIDAISKTGIDAVQVGSFVHPKFEQMADAGEVFKRIKRVEGVIYSGLVLNEKGMERAFDSGVDLICTGVSASDTHSRKNTKMSSEQAQERIIAMCKTALTEGKNVQASVQSAFGCGFEGEIDEKKVYKLIEKYAEAGIDKISLADTAGRANPAKTKRMITEVRMIAPDLEIACHFHDTYGLGMVNGFVAVECGAASIETAFGGLGGCPFTKLPAGNLCTEDFVHMLHKIGLREDIDLAALVEIAKSVSQFFGKELPGNVYKTGGF